MQGPALCERAHRFSAGHQAFIRVALAPRDGREDCRVGRMGILILLTALVLMLGQTHFDIVHRSLDNVRWLAFALMGFAYFMVVASAGHRTRRARVPDVIIVAWVAYAFLSTLYSIEPVLTVQRSTTLLLMYVAVFWAAWRYAGQHGEEKAIEIVLWALLIVCAAGLLMLPVDEGVWVRGRFRGLMENPNSLGLLAGVMFPVALERLHARRWPRYWVLVGIMAVSLVLTASRGGILAALIGSAYVLWKARRRTFLAGAVALLFAALWVGTSSRLKERWIENPILRAETIRTGSGRISEAWPAAMTIIGERPLLGHGFGTEDLLFEAYGYDPKSFREHTGSYLHNSYLGLTAQTGLVGALAFFGPLLYLLVWSALRSLHDGALDLKHGLQGVLIAALVACFFESWIYSMGNSQAFPFWLSLMLLTRCNGRAHAHP
jgi:O-antigen ligase